MTGPRFNIPGALIAFRLTREYLDHYKIKDFVLKPSTSDKPLAVSALVKDQSGYGARYVQFHFDREGVGHFAILHPSTTQEKAMMYLHKLDNYKYTYPLDKSDIHLCGGLLAHVLDEQWGDGKVSDENSDLVIVAEAMKETLAIYEKGISS